MHLQSIALRVILGLVALCCACPPGLCAEEESGSAQTAPVDATPATDSDSQPNTEGQSPADAPAPADPNAPPPKFSYVKKPVVTGREQISLVLPTHRDLQRYLRLSQPLAHARLESIKNRSYANLRKAGLDPTLDMDDAIAGGNLVLQIFARRAMGSNLMSKGFLMQCYIIRYVKKPSGQVVAGQYTKVGETPEIYSIGDAEDKAVWLVDTFISQRKHTLDNQKAKAKAGSRPAAGTKKHK